MNTILYRLSQKMQKKSQDNALVTFFDNIDIFYDQMYHGYQNNLLVTDVYRPKEYAGKIPVICVIHGGGLYMGDSRLDSFLCQVLALKGYLVYALDYRLTTQASAIEEMSDICAGFKYIEKTLDQYDGDNNRVYLIGESAGAYLGLFTVAMHNCDEFRDRLGCITSNLKIKKMALFSGMFYTYGFNLIGLIYPKQIYPGYYRNKEFKQWMNPENDHVINNIPPVLLTSSKGDIIKKFTLRFDKALSEKNIDHKLFFFDNKELPHAFPAADPRYEESLQVINYIAYEFFEKRNV